MPHISHRAAGMQASPIRKLATIAQERKKAGIQVYHLNIGQPDLPTPPEFFDAVHAFDENPVAYAMSQGAEAAVDAWRGFYDRMNVEGLRFERNELMVTTGGSEALIFALCTVLDPADELLVFEPFYTNYSSFAAVAGATTKPITLSIENGFHLPDDDVIEAAITPRTRAMLVCNPSNPTGTVFTRDELQRLVNIAIAHDIFIIADEVYRDFGFDAPVETLLSFSEARDRVILIDSASKRFNLCGARVGVIASHNADVMTAAMKFAMARLSSPTIEQLALIPVLQNAERIVPPVVEEYRKRRDVVYEGLKSIAGVTVARPEGAFYIICGLPVASAEEFAKWMIEEFEDGGETVLVAPAPGFYATPGKGTNEIRIAYVLNTVDLTRALELLQLALEHYTRRVNPKM